MAEAHHPVKRVVPKTFLHHLTYCHPNTIFCLLSKIGLNASGPLETAFCVWGRWPRRCECQRKTLWAILAIHKDTTPPDLPLVSAFVHRRCTNNKKGLSRLAQPLVINGAPARTRTGDTGIRNPLLCPFLSYGGLGVEETSAPGQNLRDRRFAACISSYRQNGNNPVGLIKSS